MDPQILVRSGAPGLPKITIQKETIRKVKTMRRVALTLTGVFSVFSIFCIAKSEAALEIVELMQTPVGIYIAVAVRVGYALLLIGAAGTSRMPRTLRIIAGLSLLYLGVESFWHILGIWSTQDVEFRTTWMVGELFFILFIAFALRPRRNPKAASSPA